MQTHRFFCSCLHTVQSQTNIELLIDCLSVPKGDYLLIITVTPFHVKLKMVLLMLLKRPILFGSLRKNRLQVITEPPDGNSSYTKIGEFFLLRDNASSFHCVTFLRKEDSPYERISRIQNFLRRFCYFPAFFSHDLKINLVGLEVIENLGGRASLTDIFLFISINLWKRPFYFF